MERLRNAMSVVRGQLWLVPALFAFAGAAGAFFLLNHRGLLAEEGENLPWWLYSGQAGTARDLLSSLLFGIMTMTSLVISVTFVILTLAANQLGPRLIVIFITDRQIQSVLGLFIGTILYLIIILRTLDNTTASSEIPHLAITVGTVLTVSCLVALLFYIHKIARSINADSVVESVFKEIRRTLGEILPRSDPEAQPEPDDAIFSRGVSLALGATGYIQVIDYNGLVAIGSTGNMCIKIDIAAGDYVLKRGHHIAVSRNPSDAEQKSILSSFTVGTERTPAQDPQYGIRQLVEIALRALSPGINDLFTALAVLDRLGAIGEEIFTAGSLPTALPDQNGVVRVLAQRSATAMLLNTAFRPIRLAGAGQVIVLERMIIVIGALAYACRCEDHKLILQNQLHHIEETTSHSEFSSSDRDHLLGLIAEKLRGLANVTSTAND